MIFLLQNKKKLEQYQIRNNACYKANTWQTFWNRKPNKSYKKTKDINGFKATLLGAVLTFNTSTIREGLCLCAVKPRQTPRSCTKFRTKTRQNPRVCSICWWQNVAISQKVIRRQLFKAVSTMLKTTCQWLMSSAFAWCRFRWPWAACPTTARTGGSKRTCFLCLYPYACIWHNCSLSSF